MSYELEVEQIIEEIKSSGAKRVLLQLPDGLKPKASEIVNELQLATTAEILIWTGSNFGGCDVPQEHAKAIGIDLLINFGHSEFSPLEKRWRKREVSEP